MALAPHQEADVVPDAKAAERRPLVLAGTSPLSHPSLTHTLTLTHSLSHTRTLSSTHSLVLAHTRFLAPKLPDGVRSRWQALTLLKSTSTDPKPEPLPLHTPWQPLGGPT